VKITASVEYAMQALLEIAKSTERGLPISAGSISQSQDIPLKFLESILLKLKKGLFVESIRGNSGGYVLSKEPSQIKIADVFRCIEGPLAAVADTAPEFTKYKGHAKNLTDAWIATRVALREVLEKISLEDLSRGNYSKEIESRLKSKDAWKRR